MLILPAIDIRDGKCVRLTQGDFKRELKYSYYPEETAIELEKAGAKFLHVVDLDGARDGVLTNIFTIKRILDNVTIPIEVGGGIRTMNDIENLLEIGVTRVILGSTAVEDPEFVRDAAEKFEDSIVVGIDAREGIPAKWTRAIWRRRLAISAFRRLFIPTLRATECSAGLTSNSWRKLLRVPAWTLSPPAA